MTTMAIVQVIGSLHPHLTPSGLLGQGPKGVLYES